MKPAVELEVTDAAKADIADILAVSADQFGEKSQRRHEALIATGLQTLRDSPFPSASTARPELGSQIRTYHLWHCRRRAASEFGEVSAPRHLLLYEATAMRVRVLRVLHDAMELKRHLSFPDDPATA